MESKLLRKHPVWLSREGERVRGNAPPDPGYYDFEMAQAVQGLTLFGKPYEEPIWMELEFMEEPDFQYL